MSRSFLLSLVVLGSAAQAQSLKDFLDSADKNSVDIQISIEQRNKAAAEYRQAWTGLFPSLTTTASWTHNQYESAVDLPKKDADGNTVIENGKPVTVKASIVPFDQLDAVFRFDLPLIDAQRWMRLSINGTAEEAAGLREQVMRDLVHRQVIGSYYGYSAALSVRDAAKKSAAVADAQLKLTEIRSGAGSATELDLARSKSEVARTRQVMADTDVLVGSTRRVLRTLTGIEAPEQLAQGADDVRPLPELAELEGRIEALPQIKAADQDRKVAGTVSLASQLALVPTVNAQFTERLTNATGFAGKALAYNAGINLVWRLDVPTFMGMQAQQANEATAVRAAERARNVARDQVNSDWLRLRSALIKIDASKTQVEAAQRAAQVARDRYAAGVATQVDVIQAERDAFGAEVSQIQARTELATARASLAISAGLPID